LIKRFKAIGFTQVEELGNIETPIALTNTLNVFLVANALIDYTLSIPGNAGVISVNPVVGEINDGYLNDIIERAVHKKDVLETIKNTKSGPQKVISSYFSKSIFRAFR